MLMLSRQSTFLKGILCGATRRFAEVKAAARSASRGGPAATVGGPGGDIRLFYAFQPAIAQIPTDKVSFFGRPPRFHGRKVHPEHGIC